MRVPLLTAEPVDPQALIEQRYQALAGQPRPARYPVLAALVPVVTDRGGEVAYPGDPMALYHALSITIANSVAACAQPSEGPALRNVVPDWGRYPTRAERLRLDGPRPVAVTHSPTSDGKVFDPRVWDPRAMDDFRRELAAVRPAVLLLSAVSPAHRYALQMAAIAKEIVPHCLVVLGGRHSDETLSMSAADGAVHCSYSGTLAAVQAGHCADVIDFVVSGDGAPLLDALLDAIGLVLWQAVEPAATRATVLAVAGTLLAERAEGRGIIASITDGARAVVSRGRPMSLAALPEPYLAFAIRARFSVFPSNDSPAGRRTAHVISSNICSFQCSFCSESLPVGRAAGRRPETSQTSALVERLAQLADWGAEAAFFDDPVFLNGNWSVIRQFCDGLSARRADSLNRDPSAALARLEWGAQLTVDVVLNRARQDEVRQALAAMREAGCSYIYIGIESMAEEVMSGVAKNLRARNPQPWVSKVRSALQIVNDAGLRVGSSILFGLDGESPQTIQRTVDEVGKLLDDGLLVVASPNILTYHPGTAISARHGMDELDYHSQRRNAMPYTLFEEAYPGVVSRLLTEADIWSIHTLTTQRWGQAKNSDVEVGG